MFEAMLHGWQAQQTARGLRAKTRACSHRASVRPWCGGELAGVPHGPVPGSLIGRLRPARGSVGGRSVLAHARLSPMKAKVSSSR